MRDITPELQTSRQEYVVNNPGNHFNDDIEVGRVRKGMSRLQVRSTLG
jgi:outer membrane protein assembly factor BamE (lipoprotein component of BamABCDE complex)